MCVDGRVAEKVGAAECGDGLASSRPIQVRAKDALQISFYGGAGGPEGERLQKIFQRKRGDRVGEIGSEHGELKCNIGKIC